MSQVYPSECINLDTENLPLSIRCRFFYETHRKKILILSIICIIALIVSIIILSPKNNKDNNPCLKYSSNDLASSISIECFRYIWKNHGCATTIPDNYDGWWLRSPRGGQMVPCIYPNTGSLCGAGNYLVIVIYSRHCNINYDGK